LRSRLVSKRPGQGPHFANLFGADMLHVPYRGEGPGLTDLVSGQLQVMFATMTGSIEFVRGGQLRALAVTSKGCPTFRRFTSSFPATRFSPGSGSGRPIIRLSKSSTG
jgi:Tripartite tricarboxylate transporter family receptor